VELHGNGGRGGRRRWGGEEDPSGPLGDGSSAEAVGRGKWFSRVRGSGGKVYARSLSPEVGYNGGGDQ
jgi:hypothetical protein